MPKKRSLVIVTILMMTLAATSPAVAGSGKGTDAKRERQLVRVLDTYREQLGLPALTRDGCLDRLAQRRARISAKRSSPTQPQTRDVSGVCNLVSAVEILDSGFKTGRAAMKALLRSSTTEALVAEDSASHVGVGVARFKRGDFSYVVVVASDGEETTPTEEWATEDTSDDPDQPPSTGGGRWDDLDPTTEGSVLRDRTTEAHEAAGFAAYAADACVQAWTDRMAAKQARGEGHIDNSDMSELYDACPVGSVAAVTSKCWDDATAAFEHWARSHWFADRVQSDRYTHLTTAVAKSPDDGTPYYVGVFFTFRSWGR